MFCGNINIINNHLQNRVGLYYREAKWLSSVWRSIVSDVWKPVPTI